MALPPELLLLVMYWLAPRELRHWRNTCRAFSMTDDSLDATNIEGLLVFTASATTKESSINSLRFLRVTCRRSGSWEIVRISISKP